MSDTSSNSGGGVGISTVLVIILFILKVGEVGQFAEMSWWIVFLP